MLFRGGHSYLAGFDKPFILPITAIRDAVEDRGFRVLGAWECEEVPLPFQVVGTCGDEFDWVALVQRLGADEEIELPSQVVWIQEFAGAPLELPPGKHTDCGPCTAPSSVEWWPSWKGAIVWAAAGAALGVGVAHLVHSR